MNRSTILLALSGAALIIASPALADKGRDASARSSEASSAAADAASTPNQRYCIVSQVTGSRINSRECHTRAEWLKQGFDPLAPRN